MRMFPFNRRCLLPVLMLLFSSSCVSQTDYNQLLDENKFLSGELANEKAEKQELEDEIEVLEDRVSELEDIIERAMYELEGAYRFSDIEYAIDILYEMY